MAHPDEGQIRAFLDGEMGASDEKDLRDHFTGCPACEAELAAQERAMEQVSRALLVLDADPDLAEARVRILEHTRSGSEGSTSKAEEPLGKTDGRMVGKRRRFIFPLSRAASIALLLTAAGVSALPGSPVRRWIVDGWESLTDSGLSSVTSEPGEGAAASAEPPQDPLSPQPGESGASILADRSPLEIWIHDLPSGAEIRVHWVDGDQVGVFGGNGIRFRTEEGRLEAFSPPGSVRVELPHALRNGLLGADGAVLLRVTEGQADISGPVERRTSTEIVFLPGS